MDHQDKPVVCKVNPSTQMEKTKEDIGEAEAGIRGKTGTGDVVILIIKMMTDTMTNTTIGNQHNRTVNYINRVKITSWNMRSLVQCHT